MGNLLIAKNPAIECTTSRFIFNICLSEWGFPLRGNDKVMPDFQMIDTAKLKSMLDAKEDFLLVDTLGKESYDQRHVPGAVCIDGHDDDFVAEVTKAVNGDKNKTVVTYCASETCQLSPTSCRKLVAAGFTKVFDYHNGIAGWMDAGNRVEGSAA